MEQMPLVRLLFLSSCLPVLLIGQSQPRYDVLRTPGTIRIDGKLDEAAWQQAPAVGDFNFNWWKEGAKGADGRQDAVGRREPVRRLLLP